MARRIVQTLVDDMDGTEAEETINFSFEGLEYRIDLSEKNADKFRKAIAPFLKAAQRVGGRAKRGKASVTRLPSGAAMIRAWAIEHGYEMPGRGRIPKDVRAAYEAAQAS